MHKSDYLRALLAPASIALVGASGKPGSMGRIVLENLIAGGFQGALHLVNPNHRRVVAPRPHASLAPRGKPADPARIAPPPAAAADGLHDAGGAAAAAAV